MTQPQHWSQGIYSVCVEHSGWCSYCVPVFVCVGAQRDMREREKMAPYHSYYHRPVLKQLPVEQYCSRVKEIM